VVQGVRDDQTEGHQQPLLHAPRGRAQVDVAVDHARHDGQMLGVDDLGVARDATVGVDADDRAAVQDQRGATYRLGARAVDQRATTNRGCHADATSLEPIEGAMRPNT
jgi:hypothetical protein